MDIKKSKRILILSVREDDALDIVKDLTGSAPTSFEESSATDTNPEWNVKTAYYTAKVPIWYDGTISDLEEWKTSFLSDFAEVREVIEEIGAWILCFQRREDGKISEEVENTMRAVQDVVQKHASGLDVVQLAVDKATATAPAAPGKQGEDGQDVDDMEDTCRLCDFEYIDYAAAGANAFGEKVGFERLKEALETNEWASSAAQNDEDNIDLGEFDFDVDAPFGEFAQAVEMSSEMREALNRAPSEGDAFDLKAEEPTAQQADGVEDLTRMTAKLLAIREQITGLPDEQRKRVAAKAAMDLVRENPSI